MSRRSQLLLLGTLLLYLMMAPVVAVDSRHSTSSDNNGGDDSSTTGTSGSADYLYKCQDLIPNLCPLDVEEGELIVKGIPVTYWKYTQKQHSSTTSSSTASSASTSDKLPIVALHGGPAFTHNYMLPLQQQACHGRPIYFYDQAGCGKSRPKHDASLLDKHPWLLDPDYYATVELPALLDHWNLRGYHIVGSSWGTLLAQLFVLNATTSQTQGLQSMVLSGPFSDSQSYIQAQWDPVDGTLGTLPDYVQDRIHTLEQQQAYQSKEYQTLNQVLKRFFTVRTPFTDCYLKAEEHANEEIYTAMQGPSEFTMSGVLAPYNVTDRLPTITVPVLLTHGRFDTMRPSIVQTMQEQLPNARSLLLERSGHVSMIDEPGKMNTAMAQFYQQVEDGTIATTQAQAQPPQRTTTTTASLHDDLWERVLDHRTFGTTTTTAHSVKASTPPRGSSMFLLVTAAVASLMVGFLLGELTARRRYRMQYVPMQ
ncbi:Proline iminopeptidase [Seminavis robusta]|uniref:Proline iminopeptidase n=1 Tax=Seminavis robusta TaxID=568900 RepID=A0A9N8F1H9_9STRA|nr:Proline iminopeptidase [Seminavis robusta]|eukprot:Sro2284_g321870.1 Proline iminopeptidase (480) ;mRNA; r:1945-3384